MSEYDQTFDPNILIGHCDLISRFSDFALDLDTVTIKKMYFCCLWGLDNLFDFLNV